MNAKVSQLLVVDDDPCNLDIICEVLDPFGYVITCASDGDSAWRMLDSEPRRFDTVLLDRMMPGIDGIQVLQRIRKDKRMQALPVILQTAASSPEQIAEGLQYGAHYYLTKPFDPDVLSAVVSTAVSDHRYYANVLDQAEQQQIVLGLLRQGVFRFRNLQEATMLGGALASLCPEPSTVAIGLTELLINAVEHGNLGISYLEKTQLVNLGTWEEEVAARLQRPENLAKYAEVAVELRRGEVVFTITDRGPGFSWREYMQLSPARAMDNHGRGIAMARQISFSSVEYQAPGNKVVATASA